MSTTSMYAGDIAGQGIDSDKGAGMVGRILGAIRKAREAQAQREVNRYLARQPDRLLRDIGLDSGDIAELRARYRHETM